MFKSGTTMVQYYTWLGTIQKSNFRMVSTRFQSRFHGPGSKDFQYLNGLEMGQIWRTLKPGFSTTKPLQLPSQNVLIWTPKKSMFKHSQVKQLTASHRVSLLFMSSPEVSRLLHIEKTYSLPNIVHREKYMHKKNCSMLKSATLSTIVSLLPKKQVPIIIPTIIIISITDKAGHEKKLQYNNNNTTTHTTWKQKKSFTVPNKKWSPDFCPFIIISP